MNRTTRSLEQRRAQAAVDILAKTSVTKELANLAKAFPAHVINNGLGAALAFLKTKKDPQHRELYRALGTWLLEKADYLPWSDRSEEDLLKRLVRQDSAAYRAATREALAFLNWYRRLATAEAGAV